MKQVHETADSAFDIAFGKPIIRYGMLTLLLAIPLCFLPSLYLAVAYNAMPPVGVILTAWFLCASVYGVEYFMTPISYYPILGNAGTYMAFLSGNISNMKVPCAMVAQEATGVAQGTNAGEIIATLGQIGATIVNLVICTIAAIAGNYLFNIFPPIILTALDFVLPSIFGGLFAMFAVRHPKFAMWGVAVAVLLIVVVKGLPTWLIVILCSFTTIGFALFTSKKKENQAS